MVGIPVLTAQRLPKGATVFGLLMFAFAGGNLLGHLITGSLPCPNGAKLRLIVIAVFASFGLLFLLALDNGFMAVLTMTWIQTHTPQEMLGRMMALSMLSGTGPMLISQAIAGVISKWNLTMLFVLRGVLVLLMTVWVAFHPILRVSARASRQCRQEVKPKPSNHTFA